MITEDRSSIRNLKKGYRLIGYEIDPVSNRIKYGRKIKTNALKKKLKKIRKHNHKTLLKNRNTRKWG